MDSDACGVFSCFVVTWIGKKKCLPSDNLFRFRQSNVLAFRESIFRSLLMNELDCFDVDTLCRSSVFFFATLS